MSHLYSFQITQLHKIAKELSTITVFMLITSGCAAVGLNWVHSFEQNLILSCIFESIISCTEAVLFCVIVEIFPPNLGATAMSLTVTCGRIGAIVGNVVFGALIDFNCVIPIYTFGTLLISKYQRYMTFKIRSQCLECK